MHVTSAVAATWAASFADKRILPVAIGATVFGVAETFVKEGLGEKIVLGGAVAATIATFYNSYKLEKK
jgi:hypothetical protein